MTVTEEFILIAACLHERMTNTEIGWMSGLSPDRKLLHVYVLWPDGIGWAIEKEHLLQLRTEIILGSARILSKFNLVIVSTPEYLADNNELVFTFRNDPLPDPQLVV